MSSDLEGPSHPHPAWLPPAGTSPLPARQRPLPGVPFYAGLCELQRLPGPGL